MARAGGLQTLTLDSTLLAHAATAKRLARKLTRAFLQEWFGERSDN